jgi:hypothetical protein
VSRWCDSLTADAVRGHGCIWATKGSSEPKESFDERWGRYCSQPELSRSSPLATRRTNVPGLKLGMGFRGLQPHGVGKTEDQQGKQWDNSNALTLYLRAQHPDSATVLLPSPGCAWLFCGHPVSC